MRGVIFEGPEPTVQRKGDVFHKSIPSLEDKVSTKHGIPP